MNILFAFTIVTVSAASVGHMRRRLFDEHHRVGKEKREVTTSVVASGEKAQFDRVTWLFTKYQSMEKKLTHTTTLPNNRSKQRYHKYFKKYFLAGPFK